jgi:hypothetical protein
MFLKVENMNFSRTKCSLGVDIPSGEIEGDTLEKRNVIIESHSTGMKDISKKLALAMTKGKYGHQRFPASKKMPRNKFKKGCEKRIQGRL